MFSVSDPAADPLNMTSSVKSCPSVTDVIEVLSAAAPKAACNVL